MSDSMKHMKAMADAAKATQEYLGSDALKHVDAMLEALEAIYKDELSDVAPENLVRLQAQLKQTKIIRQVLNKQAALPKL
jgi:hypothetical protein